MSKPARLAKRPPRRISLTFRGERRFPRAGRIAYPPGAPVRDFSTVECPLRTLLELPVEIATAFFFSATVGVAAGVVAASHTHRLTPAVQVALAAFMVAAASFG